MYKKEYRKEIMEKLVDAFDWEGLTKITDSCRDDIKILVTEQIEKIIDVYEKEHIVKELLKLAKDKEVSFGILEKFVLQLLSTKNRSEFHNKHLELRRKPAD